MKVAAFPGSFDPLTLRHLDLIERGSALFDQLAVAVMTNESKSPLFTVEEQVAQIKEAVSGLDNASVITMEGLTAGLVNRIDADYLVRDLRNTTDFQYERDITAVNNFLDDQYETIFFLTKPGYQHLSNSLLKEVASAGGDTSTYLPANINETLKRRLMEREVLRVKRNSEKAR